MHNSGKKVGELRQDNLGQLVALDTRDIAIANTIFNHGDIPVQLMALARCSRHTDMGLGNVLAWLHIALAVEHQVEVSECIIIPCIRPARFWFASSL